MAFMHPLAEAFHDELGFVNFVKSSVKPDRRTSLIFSPQFFPHSADVVVDYAVCCRENCSSRSIVLFQPQDLRIGKVFLKQVHVLNSGTPPAVDRLIVIAYSSDAVTRLCQQLQPTVLYGIGILKLVDEDVLKTFPISVSDWPVVLK